MNKVKVKICVGTTCFVMGASELQNLEDFLPEEMKNKVEISGTTCLGACKDDRYGDAPFVTVNDEVISNGTINSIIKKIGEALA